MLKVFKSDPVVFKIYCLNNSARNLPEKLDDYLLKIKENQELIHRIVRENTKISKDRQKYYYDKDSRNKINYKIGDLVLLVNTDLEPGYGRKLNEKYVGPFKIIKIFDGLGFLIQDLNTQIIKRVHYNQIKRFYDRDLTRPVESMSSGHETLGGDVVKPSENEVVDTVVPRYNLRKRH